MDFSLNPSLDAVGLAESFRKHGHVQIKDFLAHDQAALLLSHLKQRDDWLLVINQGERLFEIDRSTQKTMPEEVAGRLELAVQKGARAGFQFRYETIRVSDDESARSNGDDPLNRFARFLASRPVLELMQRVTGDQAIDFADAQATAYGPGHFLTEHDDDVAGKSRRAAYVFNLTPDWRMDWGGLLQFRGPDGDVERAYVPRFNVLNLFKVPAPHSVSYVAPCVPYRRYSITGWLRALNSSTEIP